MQHGVRETRRMAARALILSMCLLLLENGRVKAASSGHAPCNGTGTPCVIQLGGVFSKDCGSKADAGWRRYVASSTALVRIVNALNDGKGFGIKAGNTEFAHFFKFNFTYATYKPDAFDSVGVRLASDLFPRLDFIVGQGAHCGSQDNNTLKMAKIADDLGKIYFTQRGPSGFMTAAPKKQYLFSTHLNSDEYADPAIRRCRHRERVLLLILTLSVITVDRYLTGCHCLHGICISHHP